MDTNNEHLPSMENQVKFWDTWNRDYREDSEIDPASERRAEFALEAVGRSSTGGPIIDIGCGTGWLAARMVEFGEIWAMDLAEDVISRSQERWPEINFSAGDFMELPYPESHFEIVVCLETLSHVSDQDAFLKKVHQLLKPGGHLFLTSQNPFVWFRTMGLKPPGEGQIRNWPDKKKLENLVSKYFVIDQMTTLAPGGNKGIFKVVNGRVVNKVARNILGTTKLNSIKESLGYGQSLVVTAHK